MNIGLWDELWGGPWGFVFVMLPLLAILFLYFRLSAKLKDSRRRIRSEIIEAGGFESWERLHFGKSGPA